MNSLDNRSELEVILEQLFHSADALSPEGLQRACEANPQFRAEIVEFAALWALHDAAPELAQKENPVPAAAVSRLQSFVLNQLDALDSQVASSGELDAARQAIGRLKGSELKRASVAAGLFGSTLLLGKVITRRIPDVPREVTENLANYLRVTANALEKMFGIEVAGDMNYKASEPPATYEEETWEDAVRTSDVSDDDKSRLLAMPRGEFLS